MQSEFDDSWVHKDPLFRGFVRSRKVLCIPTVSARRPSMPSRVLRDTYKGFLTGTEGPTDLDHYHELE
jgi:poly-D-alanine transfer protein DltD